MMCQDEVGSDQTQIIKRKRTKRQRSSSTFVVVAAAATTVTSTSSSAGGYGGGEGERTVSDEYNSAVSCPVVTTDCTEEEEDTAICLIMLARGAVPSPDLKNSRKAERALHHGQEDSSFYVYECKTCNRTFRSFQALGGHRASHKKPRTLEEKTRLPLMHPKPSGSDEGQNSQFKVSGSALASQSSNNNIINKANKVHECSICGSEFTSGQALGGHMRRHRTAAVATSPAATLEVSKNSITEEESENLSRSMEQQRKYLPLDLNLPAPEDHDLRESKFQGIVFSSTPALIDCHY